MTSSIPFIGTAGWSIPPRHAPEFPGSGSHLARYAEIFHGVEINSSFHRPHRRSTYERWAASVPPEFRFSVKAPRSITHERRLVDVAEALDVFLAEIGGLGSKLGPLLVQLPPSLAFERATVEGFIATLRERFAGSVACEPRHASWFTEAADACLNENRVARVAADPARAPEAAHPDGWPGLAYYRLHGSPQIYRSSYAREYLDELAPLLARESASGAETWCIFDNTAAQAATENALAIREHAALAPARRRHPG